VSSEEAVDVELRERRGDEWETIKTISVARNNPKKDWAVESYVRKKRTYARYEIRHSDGTRITGDGFVEKVIKDGTKAIHLVPLLNEPFAQAKRQRLESFGDERQVGASCHCFYLD
jgi:hypothetical protein